MAARIDQIIGIGVEDNSVVDAIAAEAKRAEALFSPLREREFDAPRGPFPGEAFTESLRSVNAMLAVASAQCLLNPPPPVNIEMVTDQGRLIYRCQHDTPHKWALDGSAIP